MNNRCASCGLVNFASEVSCRRCGAAIVATAPATSVNLPLTNQNVSVANYAQQPAIDQAATESSGKCVRRMIFGLLWAIGGTVITVGTYISAASNPNGGRYFVAWGAITFGVLDFIVGFAGWMKLKQQA